MLPTLVSALATGFVLVAQAPPAPADGHRTDLLRQILHDRAHLSEPQIAELEEDLEAYARAGGTPELLAEMAATGYRQGCRDECVREVVRGLTGELDADETDEVARDVVDAALRAEQRERERLGLKLSDADRGARLRARLDRSLAEREAIRKRARARGREFDRTGQLQRGPPEGPQQPVP